MYRIFETDAFREDLVGLPGPLREKLADKLRSYVVPQLRLQPHVGANVKKSRGFDPEKWRYRLGTWRLIYEIDEARRVISLLTLAARKDAY